MGDLGGPIGWGIGSGTVGSDTVAVGFGVVAVVDIALHGVGKVTGIAGLICVVTVGGVGGLSDGGRPTCVGREV